MTKGNYTNPPTFYEPKPTYYKPEPTNQPPPTLTLATRKRNHGALGVFPPAAPMALSTQRSVLRDRPFEPKTLARLPLSSTTSSYEFVVDMKKSIEKTSFDFYGFIVSYMVYGVYGSCSFGTNF